MVPIYLLSGFLGSGKTTLLQHMIAQAQAAGLTPAVLMNELGEVNLDGQLVSREVAMAEVLGGCICCSMRGDLSLELNQLLQKYKPDLVIVESTGAAHPMESIDAITETSMYKHATLQEVVTVVDSEHLLARAKSAKDKTFRLMQEQIRCASLLILNKSDRLFPEQIVELEQLVREWNAHAKLVTAAHCQLNDWSWMLQPTSTSNVPDQLVNVVEDAQEDFAHAVNDATDEEAYEVDHATSDAQEDFAHAVNEAYEDIAHADELIDKHGSHGGADVAKHTHAHTDHASHEHHAHVMAYTHYWKQSPHSEQFEAWLKQLPENIYRAKGIVTFRDVPSRFLFQYAYRESDFMRIEPQGEVHNVAVFIGEHFDAQWLKQELEKLEQQ